MENRFSYVCRDESVVFSSEGIAPTSISNICRDELVERDTFDVNENVFSMYVGMNLGKAHLIAPFFGVFPICVGMNRTRS